MEHALNTWKATPNENITHAYQLRYGHFLQETQKHRLRHTRLDTSLKECVCKPTETNAFRRKLTENGLKIAIWGAQNHKTSASKNRSQRTHLQNVIF